MKLVKLLLLAGGIAVALALVLAGLAFVPAVQRSIALRVANSRPGIRMSADRIAVGPGRTEVSNLRLEKDGMVVTVPSAVIECSLLQAAFRSRADIARIEAKGWKLVLPAAPPAPAPAADDAPPAAFEGVFKFLTLPIEVRLGSCDIAGDVVVSQPDASQAPGELSLSCSGGGFAPGSEAKFNFAVRLAGIIPGSSIGPVESSGTLMVRCDASGAVDRIAVDAGTTAACPGAAGPSRLHSALALARAGGGERYDATLDLEAEGGPQKLLSIGADYKPGSLTGSWSVNIDHAQLAAFAPGMKLPRFTVSGEGAFTLDPARLEASTADISLSGRIKHRVSGLEAIDPGLAVVGGLDGELAFELGAREGVATLRKFEFSLNGERPVIEARLLQEVRCGLDGGSLSFADPSADLFRLSIHGIPPAWAQPFIAGLDIRGDDLTGTIAVSPLGGDGCRLRTTSPLTINRLCVNRGGRPLLRDSSIRITASVDHSPDATHATVSEFALDTADGDTIRASADATLPAGDSPAISVSADVDASLPKLAGLFAPVGALRARAGAGAVINGTEIAVSRLSAELQDGAGGRLCAVSAPQPFTLDTGTLDLNPADPAADVLRIVLGRLPLAMAAPFLPPDLSIGGELARGEFTVRSDGGSHVLGCAAPLRISGLSVSRAGTALVSGLDIEAAPAASCTPEEIRADIGGLKVTASGATLLDLTGGATLKRGGDAAMEGTATLTFTGDLAALLRQPALNSLNGLSRGSLSGSAGVELTPRPQVDARITLASLTSRETGGPLPAVDVTLKAAQQDDGAFGAGVTLLVDNAGSRTDLAIRAAARPDAATPAFDAQVSGKQVVVDDLLLLASALPKSQPAAAGRQAPAPASPAASTAPDARPFWSGALGRASVEIGRIIYGKSFQAQDIKAVADIGAGKLSLQPVEAKLGDKGALSANAVVTFTAGSPEPYDLSAAFSLKDFDMTSVFKAIDPSRPPTVEGRSTISGEASGRCPNMGLLAESIRGKFELESRSGIFRGLQYATTASKVTSVVGGLLSLAKVKGAEEVDLAGQVVGMLGEIPYDQLTIRAVRDEKLDVRLEAFHLLSPMVRLQGSGLIQHQPGVPLMNQPLRMELALAAKGALEQALARGNQLTGQRDELKYAKFREPFVIKGTPSKPDTSELKGLLTRSIVGGLLGGR